MILKGENQEIELVVEGYEFLNAKLKNNFWDDNWLVLYCKKTIEGKTISGRFPCFATTELKHLQDLLEQFLNGTIEYVEWEGTEPNFQITLHKNRLLEIFFYSESLPEMFDEVKVFKKKADYEDIKNLIKFCQDSLKKYPIRRAEEKIEENKKNKIIIYSKKKIFIQLLYGYIKKYIEKQNYEKKDTISVIIEGKTSMEMIETEFDKNTILLFDCSSREEIDSLKRLIDEEIETCKDMEEYENIDNNEKISNSKKSAHIILLDNMYYKIEEKLFFQKQEVFSFVYDLEKLTEIIEDIICRKDNLKKSSDNLTKREKEILILITKGKLNKEIANELNITERTVKNHIANLFRKINVYDRTQAAVYAIKNGIYHLYQEDV